MLHHPLPFYSNSSKFHIYASALSHTFDPSPAHDMGLKLCKKACSSSNPGRFSKACLALDSTRGSVSHKTSNAYDQRAQGRVLEEEAPQITETTPSLKTSQGQASPLGVSEVDNGINFAIFSQHATAVTLCLSLPIRGDSLDGGMIELPLDPHVNKTGDIWHMHIKDLPRSNVLYGYRIDGPQGWNQGHRFDKNTVLIDPYAKLVDGRRYFGDSSEKLSKFLGTYDFDTLPFDWGENYKLPNIPEKDLVVYEMNVRAFTADESSGLDPDIRGSYLGLIEKIPHLLELGVNAVELLPVFEFDEFEFQRRPNPRDHMVNTWGYSTINFFSPMSRYASGGGGPLKALWEFKEMVKALHGAGIEVILDVVYNHTNEADDNYPYTTSFRGIDNKVYYMVDSNGQLLNFSGCADFEKVPWSRNQRCRDIIIYYYRSSMLILMRFLRCSILSSSGNTLNCNHPVVMELILDSLRHWVVEYHVDGFRFDLASALCRGSDGSPLSAPPLIRVRDLQLPKMLPYLGVKLFQNLGTVEAFILLEVFQIGTVWSPTSFTYELPLCRWAEWNGKYRDDLRRFIKGDPGMKGSLATRVSGSADLYRVSVIDVMSSDVVN
ncbi:hypothetical protein Pint_08389 [Pistacia integerrima]|uniref:Uncharacterized protein n=1 Tax=Pistacia integerrima TaxID=434235 RepID=A0ACC0Y039_9ROSI|nr:hypothetical protein Pint_08389 [Pistacia integerrima]